MGTSLLFYKLYFFWSSSPQPSPATRVTTDSWNISGLKFPPKFWGSFYLMKNITLWILHVTKYDIKEARQNKHVIPSFPVVMSTFLLIFQRCWGISSLSQEKKLCYPNKMNIELKYWLIPTVSVELSKKMLVFMFTKSFSDCLQCCFFFKTQIRDPVKTAPFSILALQLSPQM